MQALGMVEVLGYSTSIVCADAAAKAADVKIIALDNNKPKNPDEVPVPLIMTVKMEGEISAVEAGVDAACREASKRGLLNASHIIARPGDGTEKLAVRCNVAKSVIHTLTEAQDKATDKKTTKTKGGVKKDADKKDADKKDADKKAADRKDADKKAAGKKDVGKNENDKKDKK